MPFLAAAAVSQLSPESESDVQCLAAIAVVVGEGRVDVAEQDWMRRAGYYFVGKITGRGETFDLAPQLRRVILSKGFKKRLEGEYRRCKAEVDAKAEEMRAVGKALAS